MSHKNQFYSTCNVTDNSIYCSRYYVCNFDVYFFFAWHPGIKHVEAFYLSFDLSYSSYYKLMIHNERTKHLLKTLTVHVYVELTIYNLCQLNLFFLLIALLLYEKKYLNFAIIPNLEIISTICSLYLFSCHAAIPLSSILYVKNSNKQTWLRIMHKYDVSLY